MKQSVIDKLRNMTVANGCTPEEAETARKKLDKILAARPNTRIVGGKEVRLFSVKINPGVKYYHGPTSTGGVSFNFEFDKEVFQKFAEAMMNDDSAADLTEAFNDLEKYKKRGK